MSPVRSRDAFILTALGMGVLIPFIYYGIQILCASYNPGYSFVQKVASELGSNRAVRPILFNIGIMVQGVLTFSHPSDSCGLHFASASIKSYGPLRLTTAAYAASNQIGATRHQLNFSFVIALKSRFKAAHLTAAIILISFPKP